MAKIIRDTKQREALKTVNLNLRKLKELQELPAAGTAATSLSASVGTKRVTIPVSKDTYMEVLLEIKKRVAQETMKLCEKFYITLEDDDRVLLAKDMPEDEKEDSVDTSCFYPPMTEELKEDYIDDDEDFSDDDMLEEDLEDSGSDSANVREESSEEAPEPGDDFLQ